MLSPPVAPVSPMSGETGRDQRTSERVRRSASEIKPVARIGNYTKVTDTETGNPSWTPTIDIVV